MTGTPPGGQIARALIVLRALADARQPVPLSQLALVTTLPKSTVHRTLAALAAAGATTRTPAGHTLSREWSDLLRSNGAPSHDVLRKLLTPHLVDLHIATGLMCGLAIREDSDALFLASLYGHDYLPGVARMPDRVAAHCTAAGQVLLAFDAHAVDTLAGRQLAAATEQTIVDTGRLQRKLAEIRADGVAVSRGERVPGTVGVAAPVTGRAGTVVCALSVGGPAEQVEIGHATTQLRRVAHAASLTLRTSQRAPFDPRTTPA